MKKLDHILPKSIHACSSSSKTPCMLFNTESSPLSASHSLDDSDVVEIDYLRSLNFSRDIDELEEKMKALCVEINKMVEPSGLASHPLRCLFT